MGTASPREVRLFCPCGQKMRVRPVVLMSGYTEQDATARFNGKGLSGFIQKPFEAADLLARIRAVCDAP